MRRLLTYDLEAWLPIKLRAWSPGSPERFPFLAARAFCLRCRIDALALRPGSASPDDRGLVALHDEIAREARALCDGKSLHALAFSLASTLAAYALLRRGLRSPEPGNVQKLADGAERLVYREEDLAWDDGLDDLRNLLSSAHDGPAADVLTLKHIDDYEWLVRWASFDRTSFDVHSIRGLPVAVLLRSFGHPDPLPPLAERTVRALLPLALPAYRENLACKLQAEFGWIEPLSIPSEIRLADAAPPSSKDGAENVFISDPELAQFVGYFLAKIPEVHRGSVARFWSKRIFDFAFGSWEVSIRREGSRFRALLSGKNHGLSTYEVRLGEPGPPICLYLIERAQGRGYHPNMPHQMKILFLEGSQLSVVSDGNIQNVLRVAPEQGA